MSRLLKILFFVIFVKPLVFVILGLNIRGRNFLPSQGPAILVANHNSHLDTLVLMSLFPLSQLHKVRPVAAADYFMANRYIRWFSTHCIGIIPLERTGKTSKQQLFAACHHALDNQDILIIFPEGTRGDPEELARLKKGVFHIINDRADTDVTPIAMHGLGRSLPRGEALFVPFNCDVIIGPELDKTDSATQFVELLLCQFKQLQACCLTRHD